MNSTDKRTFQVQDWRVDPWLDEISRNGQVVKLEPRTMRTLVYLALHAGEVVSIDTLLAEVWGGVVVTPDSVYQTVATLRRTLGSGTEGSTHIVNVPRRGYRLVTPVTQWDSTPAPRDGRSFRLNRYCSVAAFCACWPAAGQGGASGIDGGTALR